MPVAGPAAHRHDADVRVEQQVERDALLGAAAAQAERLPVAPDELDVAVGRDAAQGLAPLGLEHQAVVHRQARGLRHVERLLLVEKVHLLARERQFGHSGEARVGDGQFRPVLLGEQAYRRRLDPQRQVLGDDGDVVPLGLEIAGDGEDP